MTQNELTELIKAFGFKNNPDKLHIIEKWNRKIYEENKHEIFDMLSAYVDEHIMDIFPLDKLISTTTMASPYSDKVAFNIDTDEHIWYNKFNKWSWNKFENGVVKIES